MAKITIIPVQESNQEPKSYTQVGGIYGSEIKPEDFLTADASLYEWLDEVEATSEREPRFFRVR